jgi:hypothetical protein
MLVNRSRAESLESSQFMASRNTGKRGRRSAGLHGSRWSHLRFTSPRKTPCPLYMGCRTERAVALVAELKRIWEIRSDRCQFTDLFGFLYHE